MLRLTSILAFLLMILTSGAEAQWRRDWIPLGQQTVGFNVDRDVIAVNQPDDWYRERSLRSIYFLVDRNDVYMMGVRLTYQNGFTEDFRIDQVIRDGSEFELNLSGERNYIKQIEMLYRARPEGGRALVSVYGVPARAFDRNASGWGPRPGFGPGFAGPGGPAPNPQWVELGCKEVNIFTRDRDAISLGRREARFRSIRLAVRDADIEIRDLRVVYLSGRPDDLSVQSLIRVGERSRPIDLQGWERGIDRIEMIYRTVINPANVINRGQLRGATVCIEGLQSL